jgi:ABC-type multidrug transport system fused ATPase/permease subunit
VAELFAQGLIVFKESAMRLSRRGRLLLKLYAICQFIGLTLDLSGLYIISTGLRHWANSNNSTLTTQHDNYLQYLVFGAVLLFFRSLCSALANLLVLRRLAGEEALIAVENYDQWQAQPLHIRRNTEPSLLKIIFQETPNIRVQMILVKSISAFIEIINCFFIFIVIGIASPFVSIGSIIFYTSVGLFQHRYLSSPSLKVGKKNVQSHAEVYDLLDIALRLTDVLEVMPSRSFGRNLLRSRQKSARALVDSHLLQLLPRLSLELSLFLGLTFVIGFTYFLDSGTSSEISLGLFLLLSFRLVPTLSSIQSQISQIQTFLPFLERDLTSATEDKQHPHFERLDGDNQLEIAPSASRTSQIQFKNVSFRYPDSALPSILNINFELRKGLIYALVGPNGSGKSTLINTLLGTLAPTSGSINVANESELVVGYVPQTAELFDGSIAQNIAIEWESEFVDDEKISHLQTGISKLIGIESDFSSHRTNQLSGGQKQLVCLMRALYRSPELLILDEANSFLDDANEKLYDDLIHLDKKNRFTLLVSHRVHSVLNADQVILMEKGRILDIGSVTEIRQRQPGFDHLLATSERPAK